MHNHGNYIVCLGNVVPLAGASRPRRWASRSSRASPPPRCSIDEDGSVNGVATGDMGVGKDGEPTGQLRAGHRAARDVHPVRRGLPRLAHQAADGALRACARAATRRPTASASRSCGRSIPAKHQPGLVVHTHRLAAGPADLRRLVPLSPGGQPGRGRLRRRARLREPVSLARSRSSSASRPTRRSAAPSRAAGASPTARARSTRAASRRSPSWCSRAAR